jgi:hypothetical protein
MGNLPPSGKYNGSGDITTLVCNKKIKVINYSTKINLVLIEDKICDKYIIQIKNKFFDKSLIGMIDTNNKIIILDNNMYHTIRYEKNDTTSTIIHTYNGNYKNKHISGCEEYTFDLPPP